MAADGRRWPGFSLEELTGDERLLAELVRAATLSAAAEAAGMPERTARRHARGEAFQAELSATRAEMRAVRAAQAVDDWDLGRRVLREIVADSSQPASVRVRCAERLVALDLEVATAHEMDVRFSRIERRLGLDPGTGWRNREDAA